MSLFSRSRQPRLTGRGTPGASPPADATTILAIFVALQLALPSKLVLNGLPLSLSAASLVALGLGVWWLCAQLTTTLGAAKGSSPVRSALFAYSCVLLASYGNAALWYLPPDDRANSDRAMVLTFSLIAVGLAVCDGVRSRERLYFLLRVMVVFAAGVAVVGILQYLLNFDLASRLRPPGMHFTATDPIVLERSGLRRVSGTAAHPIEFGVFCAMTLPLAIHVALTDRRQSRHSILWRACVGLIAVGLMFSVSRSAILAAAAGGIVLFCGWSGRQRLHMLVTGGGFLLLIELVSPGLLRTFVNLFRNAGSDDSVRYRTHDYETAQELIIQHPALGRGLGTWYAPKHVVFDNQYLLTLVEVGILGLFAFLAILAMAAYSALRVMFLCQRFPGKLKAAGVDRDLALSLTASLAAMLPSFATFDFSSFATVSAVSFLLMGVCGALYRIVRADVECEILDPALPNELFESRPCS